MTISPHPWTTAEKSCNYLRVWLNIRIKSVRELKLSEERLGWRATDKPPDTHRAEHGVGTKRKIAKKGLELILQNKLIAGKGP